MAKKAVFVISPKDFRDEELFFTKEELEKKGIKTVIASLKTGECIGMRGGKANSEITINQINSKDFDAIIFVGGSGASVYFDNNMVLKIAREFAEKNKIVAAICIAPSTLANAGLLKGKKATSFQSEAANLKEKGAIVTGEPVTVDGKIITANGPGAAREFGRKIADALK
ncbi:MAG: DJ-1/PfpI family protein [Candidatus Diapherotrites archaeon]